MCGCGLNVRFGCCLASDAKVYREGIHDNDKRVGVLFYVQSMLFFLENPLILNNTRGVRSQHKLCEGHIAPLHTAFWRLIGSVSPIRTRFSLFRNTSPKQIKADGTCSMSSRQAAVLVSPPQTSDQTDATSISRSHDWHRCRGRAADLRRSATSGTRTDIITTRRMISGPVLKCQRGCILLSNAATKPRCPPQASLP